MNQSNIWRFMVYNASTIYVVHNEYNFYKFVCLVHLHSTPQTMNMYLVWMNINLAIIYYEWKKSNVFMNSLDVMLSDFNGLSEPD